MAVVKSRTQVLLTFVVQRNAIKQALFIAVNTDTVLTPTHPLLPNAHVGVIPTGKVKFGFFKFVFLLWKLLIKRDEEVQVNKHLDAHRYLIDLFY